MTAQEKLIWGAITGLYGWQFVHGRWCADWRTKVSETLGEIKGRLGMDEE